MDAFKKTQINDIKLNDINSINKLLFREYNHDYLNLGY